MIKIVIALKITSIRKVHQPRKMERTERPIVIMARPTYHHALRSRTIYSSACQEISCNAFVMFLLYHICEKYGRIV